MKRAIILAFAIAGWQSAAARAAGPFDGDWKGGGAAGGATTAGRCPATTAEISVADGRITGSYTTGRYTYKIGGSVAADGTATGRWAVYPFTGKFAGSHFTGSYDSGECGAQRSFYFDKAG